MGNKRIDYIDTAKGLCIILVVMWHCIQFCEIKSYVFYPYIMSFLMPLFFVLSGMFFKTYGSFTKMVRHKMNTLLVPFITFYILTCIFLHFVHLGGFTLRELYLVSVGWIRESFDNGALWFLPCLFNCNIIFFLLVKLSAFSSRTGVILGILSLLVGGMGYLLGYYHINLWMFIDSSMTCIPYFYFGYMIKNQDSFMPCYSRKKLLFYSISLGAVLWALTGYYGEVGYKFNTMRCNFLIMYVSGVVGSIMIIAISKFLGKISYITFIGRNTLIILVTHFTIIECLHGMISKRLPPPPTQYCSL